MQARVAIGAIVAFVAAALLAGCGSSKGTLRGTVSRADGTPVGNTRLTLTPIAKGSVRTAMTDASGRFAADLEQGRYRFSVALRVSDVFECGVPYRVEIRTHKTLERRFTVPLVDVAPNLSAALPHGRTTKCKTLADPLRAFLCRGARTPLNVFALPPRDLEQGTPPYQRIASITKDGCGRITALGRLAVPAYLKEAISPFGWLLVSAAGKHGWASPEPSARLSPQLEAWEDVATAKAAALPTRSPVLAGAGLPDLSYTKPFQTHHVGEACDPTQHEFNEWAVSVRNTGRGLTPKRFSLFISNGFQTELRHLGDSAWVRGLAPGESVPIGIPFEPGEPGHTYLALSAYSQLKLDPDNAIRESNEANNALKLGYLPTLTCNR